MARVLYSHLNADDVASKAYPEGHLIHWEIRSFFTEQSYISIYWFKYGIPFDKEPINGIAFYGYEADENILNDVREYLYKKFEGKLLVRSHRIFFDNSKVIIDNISIATLAKDIDKQFKCMSEISLEFDNIEEELVRQLFHRPLIIEK